MLEVQAVYMVVVCWQLSLQVQALYGLTVGSQRSPESSTRFLQAAAQVGCVPLQPAAWQVRVLVPLRMYPGLHE